ncbi:hypothetical protein Nstercoris_00325 [Nitrosomonas stercoris]|uniref:Uncharacterized protein n=1 Tax=Nitrosomonas stercoris TaxID=1444684 RepID=A0A4Y1YJ52_9PROT|nr:hypothetical protein Nstercoris_00325 [Nitrosomonas stercoris]
MIKKWITTSMKWLIGMLLGMTFGLQAYAHGGLSMAEDMCKLTVGPYFMHFTGYQPESSQEQEFCEDIPNTGRTIVALDYIDEALRPLTTEVRIIVDTGAPEGEEGDLEQITVMHIPAQVYANGSITFEHFFPEEGDFVGLVTVNDNGTEYVSRFPFAVGTGGKFKPNMFLWPLLIIIIGGSYFFYSLRKDKKEKEEKKAES